MIENEQKQEAVKVVTALARFFRISLSRGKSIIPVRDELEHVRNYLTIQQMRFKNKFLYEIHAEEEVKDLACLKLMMQPLVENAIYHGMEFMDGDGEIHIEVRREGNNWISPRQIFPFSIPWHRQTFWQIGRMFWAKNIYRRILRSLC